MIVSFNSNDTQLQLKIFQAVNEKKKEAGVIAGRIQNNNLSLAFNTITLNMMKETNLIKTFKNIVKSMNKARSVLNTTVNLASKEVEVKDESDIKLRNKLFTPKKTLNEVEITNKIEKLFSLIFKRSASRCPLTG